MQEQPSVEKPSPLVPIHNWSNSSLKWSRTLAPYLLIMPDRGWVGRGSWRETRLVPSDQLCSSVWARWSLTFLCLIPIGASSGFPFSINFLWSFCSLSDSLGGAAVVCVCVCVCVCVHACMRAHVVCVSTKSLSHISYLPALHSAVSSALQERGAAL